MCYFFLYEIIFLSLSKKPIKMAICFYPTLKNIYSQLILSKLSSTIAMTAHCFGALSQVRVIGHCVIGEERDYFDLIG